MSKMGWVIEVNVVIDDLLLKKTLGAVRGRLKGQKGIFDRPAVVRVDGG